MMFPNFCIQEEVDFKKWTNTINQIVILKIQHQNTYLNKIYLISILTRNSHYFERQHLWGMCHRNLRPPNCTSERLASIFDAEVYKIWQPKWNKNWKIVSTQKRHWKRTQNNEMKVKKKMKKMKMHWMKMCPYCPWTMSLKTGMEKCLHSQVFDTAIVRCVPS